MNICYELEGICALFNENRLGHKKNVICFCLFLSEYKHVIP